MKQTLAQMNFLVDTETGEIDIKLNIDYTNQHSVEVFKDVLKKFANDVQDMTSETLKVQKEKELEDDINNTVKRLLSDLEYEDKLDEIVETSLPIY